MQYTSQIPLSIKTEQDCPSKFKWFFFAKWDPNFLSFQDPLHVLQKLWKALVKKQIKLGSGIADRAKLFNLVNQRGKTVLGFSANELTQSTERMNYKIASKVCDQKVIDELTQPDEYATKVYLTLMNKFKRAFIDNDTTPKERINAAWYVALHMRAIKSTINCTFNKEDSLKATVSDNFISHNVAACIELNGHNLIIFHNLCRDLGISHHFLPTLLNSQHCEGSFRTLRGLSTINATRVNFDTIEVLRRSDKVRILEEAPITIKDFISRNKKPKDYFIATDDDMLTDDGIEENVINGSKGTKLSLDKLRKI